MEETMALIDVVNLKYKELKQIKSPYQAPELLDVTVSSDQIKAVVSVFESVISGMNVRINELEFENLKLKATMGNVLHRVENRLTGLEK
jgi:hypothetical protein